MKKRIGLRFGSMFLAIMIGFSLFGEFIPIKAAGQNDAAQSSITKPGDEIISDRTETAKKHYLGGNTYAWDVSTDALHYKDNYADQSEQWKDIDLSFDAQNRIAKAPYELTVNAENYSITVKDKKTGKATTLKLNKVGDINTKDLRKTAIKSRNRIQWEDVADDMDLAVTAGNTRVSFDWIVKSENAPHEVEFEIQDDGIPLAYAGLDANGEPVKITAEKAGNKITERIEKGGKYPKIINPEIRVGSSSDNGCVSNYNPGGYDDYWAGGNPRVGICYWSYYSHYYHLHSWYRWTGFSIPSGSDIGPGSKIILRSYSDMLWAGGINTSLYFDDQSSPSAPSSASDYLGRTPTSNYVTWNIAQNSWTADTDFPSNSIENVFQELVSSFGTITTAQALHKDNTAEGGSTANRYETSYGYSSPTNYAPLLHIEYQPPAAPTNLSASDGTYSDKIQISWTASSGAVGYKIYRHTQNNSSAATQVGTSSSSPYDDISAAVATTYYYWVKAYNDGGDSGFSSVDTGNLLFRKNLGIAISSDFDDIAFGDATNFADIIRDAAGWNQSIVSHIPLGTWWQEESSGGIDNDKADYCELTYLGAHGDDNNGGWNVTKILFPGSVYVESNTVRLGYASADGFGKSIWVFISSCKLLKDSSYTSWIDTLQGTHMLLGYKSNAVGSAPDLENLANRLTGSNGFQKEKIQDAFFHTYVADDGMHNNNWCRILAENADVANNDWIDFYYPIITIDSTKVIIDSHL